MNNTLQLKVITALQDKLSAPLKRIMGASGKSGQTIVSLQQKLKGLEQTQKTVGQFRELSSGLRATGEKMQQAQGRVAQLANGMRQTQAPTKAMQREFKQAVAASQKLKNEHQQQSQRLQALRDKLSNAGLSTRSLASAEMGLRGNIARTTEALRQQTQQLEKTEQRQRKLTAAREQMNKGMMRTGAIAGTGLAAKMTGMHVGRKMANLLHVGYEFEAQMSALQGVTRIDDKNDPRMQALEHQARTLPLSSKFTDLEVAQGQFFLGRTGYTPDQILAAMPHMLDLAAAGDMDLATTADIASNIQTAFDIPRDQMQRVADVMAAMFTRNNVDIQMLGQSLKYSAVMGKEFGQSFESVTAATAMLGNAGIQADMAGTTMRQILLRIGGSSTMKDLGIKTHDEKGNMRQLTDLLVDIGKVTGPMGNVLRGEIFKDIADQRAVAAFSTLVTKAQTGELQDMIAVAHNAQGEAAALAKKQMDNLKGDISVLRAGLENISIELFTKNVGMLRKLAQGVTNFLHSIKIFLEKHPAISKAIVILGLGLAGLLTVFGSLTMALAMLLGPFIILRFASTALGMKIPGLTGMFRSLGKTLTWLGRGALPLVGKALAVIGRALYLSPIGLAVAAIAGAAFLIYKYWQPIQAFMIGVGQGIANAVIAMLDDMRAVLALLAPLWDVLSAAIATSLGWIRDLFAPLQANNKALQDATFYGQKLGEVLGLLFNLWFGWKILRLVARFLRLGRVWQWLSRTALPGARAMARMRAAGVALGAGVIRLRDLLRALGTRMMWLGNVVFPWLKRAVLGVLSVIRLHPVIFALTAIASAAYAIYRYWEPITDFFRDLWDGIKGAFDEGITGVGKLILNWSPLGQIHRVFARVFNWFGVEVPPQFTDFGANIIDSFIKGIESMGEKVKEAIFGLLPDWPDWLKGVGDAIGRGNDKIKESTSGMADGTLQWFKDTLGINSPSRVFNELGGSIPEGAALGITRQQPLAEKAAQLMAAGVLAAGAPSAAAAAAPTLTFDTRPPITAVHVATANAQAQYANVQASATGDQIEIHIHAAPGMPAQDIAAAVARELDKRAREKQARLRSSLWDIA